MQCLEKDKDGSVEDILRWIQEGGDLNRNEQRCFRRGLHMLFGGLF